MGRFAEAMVRDTKLQTGARAAELLEKLLAEQQQTNRLLHQQNGYLYALLERGGNLDQGTAHRPNQPGG